MNLSYLRKNKIPSKPGVYIFKKGKKILYIGKASLLKERVRSYFSSDLFLTRGPRILKMVEEARSLDFKTTGSVLEALILEAFLIKKHQPPYNTKEKDDKSYYYVVITKVDFPRVILVRGKELDNDQSAQTARRFVAGPFPHGSQLREALKIIRKIFPFRDKCSPPIKASPKPCFNRQIGLCPGVCTGEIDKKEYGKQIKNIELFFQGKKERILNNLEKEMKLLAKKKEFEKAGEIKKKIFAINHIRDVSLLKAPNQRSGTFKPDNKFRIEAYDIAHTSGQEVVGVMVVMENGELNKNEYRKFKVRGDGKTGIDDTKNLKEILIRRLGHAEWELPNLIVLDGGIAQFNIAQKTLKERNFNIDLVSVVKDEKHKPKEFLGEKSKINKYNKEILLVNNEAHRFAIAFHKKRRGTAFLTKRRK